VEKEIRCGMEYHFLLVIKSCEHGKNGDMSVYFSVIANRPIVSANYSVSEMSSFIFMRVEGGNINSKILCCNTNTCT
jgi:hypothetical protein